MCDENTENTLRSVLQSEKDGVPLKTLQRDFQMLVGSPIPFSSLGFASLEAYLKSVPHVAKLIRDRNGITIVQAVATENTKHLSRLVERQKSNKKSRVVVKRPQRPRNDNTRKSYNRNCTEDSAYRTFPRGQMNKPVATFQPVRNSRAQYETAPRFQRIKATSPPPPEMPMRRFSPPLPQELRIRKNSSPPPPRQDFPVRKSSPPPPPPLAVMTRLNLSPVKTVTQPIRRIADITERFSKVQINQENLSASRASSPPPAATYKELLENYARIQHLDTPVFNTLTLTKGGLIASVKINGVNYSSYPLECRTQGEAVEQAARQAVEQLGLKTDKKKLTVSYDVNKIFERIKEILKKYPRGVVSTQVPKDYAETYNESLPDGWLDIVIQQNICDSGGIESQRLILYPKVDEKMAQNDSNDNVIIGHHDMSENDNVITISETALPFCENWDVFVCYATSTTSVFIRLIEFADQFDHLATAMETKYSKHADIADNLFVGGLFAARFGDSWHRVEVMSILEDKSLCLFIDNGDSDYVSVNDLSPLEPEFLDLPKQAIQCQLHGLEKYSNHATALISLDLLVGNTFVASVNKREDALSLTLYDTSGEEDENVNDKIEKLVLGEDISPHLPKVNGVCEVYLSHVLPNGDLYVQVIGKCNAAIEELLESIRPNCENYPHVKSVVVGGMYLAKYAYDQKWYRAEVLLMEANDNVRLNFVDFGNIESVPISYLRDLEPINEILARLPHQALKCNLYAIPPSNDLLWSAEVIERLYSLAMPNHRFLLKVKTGLTTKSSPTVELFKRIQPANQLININGTLGCESYLFSKSQGTPAVNGSVKYTYNSDHWPIGTKVSTSVLEPPELPDIGGCFDVHISLAASPSNFRCQPWHTLVELEKLTEKMQNHYKDEKSVKTVPLGDVKIGNHYACKHKADQLWYRTEVKGLDSTESVLSLYYIDFGDTVVTNRNEIRMLPASFRELPYQALFCKLADVEPVGGDWLPEDCIRFQSSVTEKQFVAEIQSKSWDTNDSLILGVKLIDTHGSEDLEIGKVLIDEGRALPLRFD